MGDLIDRNDAIEAIEFEKVYMTAYKGSSNGYVSEGNPFKQYNKGLDDAIKAINSLAPADPERKKGKWIFHIDDLFPEESTQECSVCHAEEFTTIQNNNYCPNCGARMEGNNE